MPGSRLFAEVVERLAQRHSPEQITGRLKRDFPDDPEMWVSHETIYQALYVRPKSELAKQVNEALRTGRTRRKPQGRQPQTRLKGMINISERPAEAEDRAVPGHWEGDLILGAGCGSAIGTLVERSTGFVLLLHLPGDHTAATVAEAMSTTIHRLPEQLRRSLTWDQGSEMALHTKITAQTGLPIYFCDPHSPWQRGTNENTNGLLRQYFPKGTDLSFYGPGLLDQVAAELNARPRKRLNFETPAEALARLLPNPTASVASNSDVFMVPRRSAVTSRLDVDLTSGDGVGTTLPLVVANMTAISGRRMAETVARRGGVAIIPQDIPTDVVASSVRKVKASHPVFDTPVSVSPHSTVGEAVSLLPKRAHGLVVVVEDGRPIGTLREAEATGVDRFAQVHEVMSSDLLVVSPQLSPREIFDELASHHLDVALVVDDGRLLGVMTPKHALRSTLYRPALDADGALLVGAAVGIDGDVGGRAEQLLAGGIDVLVVDTAHGHQEKMIMALKAVREARDRLAETGGRRVPLVAGNVVSADGVTDLVEAGADVIKVGVGPGAMCTTRMMTGVGRPQFSAVLECAEAARRLGQVDLGRRRGPLSARRRPGPRRRGRIGDDRVLVRRDVREHGQPADRCSGPDVQGVLRHGLGSRGEDADQGLQRLRPRPGRAVRGGHLVVADVPGPRAAQCRRPDRLDDGVRSSFTYAGATSLEEFQVRWHWSECSPAPVTKRGVRCTQVGDAHCHINHANGARNCPARLSQVDHDRLS